MNFSAKNAPHRQAALLDRTHSNCKYLEQETENRKK